MIKKIAMAFLPCMMLLMISCESAQRSAISKINALATEVEKENESYSEEDWEKANKKFEEQVAKLKENSENMTPEERKEALKAIGRYNGLCVKQGFKSVMKETQKMLEDMPAVMEGFMSAFDE